MRQISKLVLSIALLISISFQSCWASGIEENLDVYGFKDSLSFNLNGESFYGSYFIKENTTYMKLRDLGEVLGIDLKWDGSTQKISFFDTNSNEVNLWIDKSIAQIGNKTIKLNSPPSVKDQYTYLPLRFVSELLGINVNYKDFRAKENYIREIIFKDNPSWKIKEQKGRYKFNYEYDGYATFILDVDSYDANKNIITFHAFDIISYPDEGHTATYDWLYVDLNNNTMTNFFGDVISID